MNNYNALPVSFIILFGWIKAGNPLNRLMQYIQDLTVQWTTEIERIPANCVGAVSVLCSWKRIASGFSRCYGVCQSLRTFLRLLCLH